MNFNEFVNAVAYHFRDFLGEDYEISTNEVLKNNNIHLNGILMKKRGQKITPNIYLNGFYERYIETDNLEFIYKEIWEMYTQALLSFDSEHFDFQLDYNSQKDNIVYRLVNYKKNQSKLDGVPYIRFLDLAITFHCSVTLQEDTVSMLPITNAIMTHWKTDAKCLFQLASKNTQQYFPLVCNPLEEVIKQLVNDKEFAELFPHDEDDVQMYVISNEQGVNGASVMLYEEAFQHLSEKIGDRFYILPSSIHEVILIPYEEDIDGQKLLQLVHEVNQTQVPSEDILSDHVYLYSSASKSFEIL